MKATILFRVLSIAMVFLILCRCISFMVDPYDFEPEDYEATDTVSSSQAKLIKTESGASIYIPVDAVPPTADGKEGSLVFTIEKDDKVKIPDFPANETMVSQVYKFGPSGHVLASPVKITIPLTDSITDKEIKIYRINTETGLAEEYPATVDYDKKEVSTYTNEFSPWYCTARAFIPTAYGLVKLYNYMPVPVRAYVSYVELKYSDADKFFNKKNAYCTIGVNGQIGLSDQIEWFLPQGKYTVCLEWHDGHLFNQGVKFYSSTLSFELKEPAISNYGRFTPEKEYFIHIMDPDEGSCADKPRWTPSPHPGDGDSVAAVVPVTNPNTGKIWMDRNLGASRLATSSTDEQAYGDLYQWGRGADGHQKRNSSTTTTLSSSDTPGHGNFILTPGGSDNWHSLRNDNLWQGVNGINNPCPSGYRLPTIAEWEAELQSWGSNNAAGAFASPLKLPMAGSRSSFDGSLFIFDIGEYWSSTVDGSFSRYLFFFSDLAGTNTDYGYRRSGHSVRCIKD